MTTSTAAPENPANRLGLDYRSESRKFRHAGPITDVHTHVGSPGSARVYLEAADAFGITRTFSMTNLESCEPVREAAGDRIEFIAVPNYAKRDEPSTFTSDWLDRIRRFREEVGARVIKFWAAPRGRDLHTDALRLDSPHRREQMKLAYDLGYRIFMTHVADPDTWFATKYADASVYGTKPEHYKPLEEHLARYRDVTWIAAHMAGSPENLEFVQGLLDRHPNLVIDTSATKWMVRELSRHPRDFADLCRRNRGRVLFGSDIVTTDDNAGFDLYASRYWALRTLMESDYDGPSPIVDPDLPMVDPSLPATATAHLRGASLDDDTLGWVYHGAAQAVFDPGCD